MKFSYEFMRLSAAAPRGARRRGYNENVFGADAELPHPRQIIRQTRNYVVL